MTKEYSLAKIFLTVVPAVNLLLLIVFGIWLKLDSTIPANGELNSPQFLAISALGLTIVSSLMIGFFLRMFETKKRAKPPYLDRIDELNKVDIVRLKGFITRDMIPTIEARIQENRDLGSKIDKNLILDFKKVVDVDSATVAVQMHHSEEYRAKGYEIGLININEEMKSLLEIFKNSNIKVFPSEAEAVRALNK